jgi:hypothetical protein
MVIRRPRRRMATNLNYGVGWTEFGAGDCEELGSRPHSSAAAPSKRVASRLDLAAQALRTRDGLDNRDAWLAPRSGSRQKGTVSRYRRMH